MEKESNPIHATSRDRLPMYFRAARELLMKETYRANSELIGRTVGLPAEQVRFDLRLFGIQGQRGYGYNLKVLYTTISTLLGAGNGYRAIYLGQSDGEGALADPALFLSRGVTLTAVFSVQEPTVVGVLPLRELEAYLQAGPVPHIAVFGPGLRGAEETARMLAGAGVLGIWNLSEVSLHNVGCAVENFNPGDSLMRLCCAVKCDGETP